VHTIGTESFAGVGELKLTFDVIEGHVFGVAVFGKQVLDPLLLLGRQHLLAVVVAIVFPVPEVILHPLADCFVVLLTQITEEFAESPRHIHVLCFREHFAFTILQRIGPHASALINVIGDGCSD